MHSDQDPIIAIATAPGRGGIGVIRISGKDVEPIILSILQRPLTPRHAHFLPFIGPEHEIMDEGIAIFFNAPHSYTGENVLELQGHGGPMVLRRILEHCLAVGRPMGLRLAEPGEFTRRAFLNDRLDLAQAEAVADLIDASSESAARSAAASMRGLFSKQVNDLADQIIHLRMLVEATLDFPEEEIEFLEKYQAHEILKQIRNDLTHVMSQAKQGVVLRDGLKVVLAGQPNVGKSSLLNALAGDDIAIVTPIAGTTRDKVTQEIHIQGVPIHIIDTAGLRQTEDLVEKIGIERTLAELQQADLILFLQDLSQGVTSLQAILGSLGQQHLPDIPVLQVVNKMDLNLSTEMSLIDQGFETLFVSAKTGQGLPELRERLLSIAGWNPSAESPYLARERHVQALKQAEHHLSLAEEHAQQSDRILDLFAEELRLAHTQLSSITGVFTSDDLLGVIFSEFCIGK